jgi:hypothetical protein
MFSAFQQATVLAVINIRIYILIKGYFFKVNILKLSVTFLQTYFLYPWKKQQ